MGIGTTITAKDTPNANHAWKLMKEILRMKTRLTIFIVCT